MKNSIKKIFVSLLALCSFAAYAGCSFLPSGDDSSVSASYSDSESSSSSAETNELHLSVSKFEGEVSLADPSVTAWLNGDENVLISEAVSASVSDRGMPVTIGYEVKNLTGKTVRSASVQVAKKDDDLATADKVKIAKNKTSAEIYNLLPNAEYRFSVTVTFSDDTELTEYGAFTTADGVRFIYAQNGINMREIGGWKTEDGKTIKRGMVFRGGELDGKVESSFALNYKGIVTMHDTLGIRYDMDLRSAAGDTSTTSVIGEDVPKKYYDLVYYQSATTTDAGLAKLKEIFTDLAKPENYPVYIHCTYGTDRTGTILAILEGLLGMSKADITREYELTYLYFPHVNRNYGNANGETFLKLLESIENADGATFAEKTANILLTAGVTQEQIDTIRATLLQA